MSCNRRGAACGARVAAGLTWGNRGEAVAIYIVAVAVVGLLVFIFNPAWFPGEARRAAKSTQATKQLVKAVDEQGAAAAASVVEIGKANTMAEESPARNFISQEIPVALSRLPPPSLQEQILVEKRRVAVMEGQLDEARKLYSKSNARSAELQQERDEALAARREADVALEKAAAAAHQRGLIAMGVGVFAVIILALWIYTKIYSIGPSTLGTIVAEIRQGQKGPIQVITDNLGPRFYEPVQKAAKLVTPLAEEVPVAPGAPADRGVPVRVKYVPPGG